MPHACNFIKKETLAQVLFCEFCELSKNTFLQNTYGRLLLDLNLRDATTLVSVVDNSPKSAYILQVIKILAFGLFATNSYGKRFKFFEFF